MKTFCRNYQHAALAFAGLSSHSEAFSSPTNTNLARGAPLASQHASETSDWGTADNWNSMSVENPENKVKDFTVPFQEVAAQAAREMEITVKEKLSDDDLWVNSVVDEINNFFSPDDPRLYDTKSDDSFATSQSFLDDMGKEISMLVRCNESPETMLIKEGRALLPLTQDEINDVTQLVEVVSNEFMPTSFLKEAVSRMFHVHAVRDEIMKVPVLNRNAIAAWMTKALQTEKGGRVSPHDGRVIFTVSTFGTYGSGHLVEDEFLDMYVNTIMGSSSLKFTTHQKQLQHFKYRKEYTDAVFRDIRSHGILTPVEAERVALETTMREKYGSATAQESRARSADFDSLLDECEILEWDNYFEEDKEVADAASDQRQASGSKSSHRIMHMVPGTKTPLYVRDGQFVFIDEESCIGCRQCANVSPSSFLMLESGRARSFEQRSASDVEQAVRSCPVSCMHRVSFTELTELETARDEGDGRTDHRHLGKAHIPLHVAMRDTDANHRTSWYHTIKHRCFMSASCPQKGCYDCPKFNNPGDNPFWKERQRKDDHLRATHFVDSGAADPFRKAAEL